SRVTGLDLSEGMLAVMRSKLAAAGLEGRVVCTQGDSEALPYAGGSFDCVTIAFGIRNFEHRETALREILRVLKPGGKLVILELSVPSNPVIRWCYNLYFTRILPLIGGKVSGDKAAYRYLPASVLNFPAKDEWMATMRACGYDGVRHKAFTLGICRMYVGLKA
ncbi:MAG: ubiquinone/menaquinone biosynthesis methyltransferase, partial [Bacteroidales bacterium]|nr:ubiquinone/menaquinone biosynthesis methyltransferase [Bacteroidales bacterium]